MFQSLSFQEKSSWVMLLALGVSGAFYLRVVTAMGLSTDGTLAPNIAIVVLFVLVLVGLSIVGHVIAALMKPSEANARPDERDKAIIIRAGHYSGMVFGLVTLIALGFYLVLGDGNILFHTVFLGLIGAQMLEYVFQIILFRRAAG